MESVTAKDLEDLLARSDEYRFHGDHYQAAFIVHDPCFGGMDLDQGDRKTGADAINFMITHNRRCNESQ